MLFLFFPCFPEGLSQRDDLLSIIFKVTGPILKAHCSGASIKVHRIAQCIPYSQSVPDFCLVLGSLIDRNEMRGTWNSLLMNISIVLLFISK